MRQKFQRPSYTKRTTKPAAGAAVSSVSKRPKLGPLIGKTVHDLSVALDSPGHKAYEMQSKYPQFRVPSGVEGKTIIVTLMHTTGQIKVHEHNEGDASAPTLLDTYEHGLEIYDWCQNHADSSIFAFVDSGNDAFDLKIAADGTISTPTEIITNWESSPSTQQANAERYSTRIGFDQSGEYLSLGSRRTAGQDLVLFLYSYAFGSATYRDIAENTAVDFSVGSADNTQAFLSSSDTGKFLYTCHRDASPAEVGGIAAITNGGETPTWNTVNTAQDTSATVATSALICVNDGYGMHSYQYSNGSAKTAGTCYTFGMAPDGTLTLEEDNGVTVQETSGFRSSCPYTGIAISDHGGNEVELVYPARVATKMSTTGGNAWSPCGPMFSENGKVMFWIGHSTGSFSSTTNTYLLVADGTL